MSPGVLTDALLVATVAVLSAAGVATWWGSRAGLGVLAGGLWNVASLWILGRLLSAWLVPPAAASAEGGPALVRRPFRQRQAAGWLLLKFPLLYALAFLALRSPVVSLIGFGVGFTVALVAVMASLWCLTFVRQSRLHG